MPAPAAPTASTPAAAHPAIRMTLNVVLLGSGRIGSTMTVPARCAGTVTAVFGPGKTTRSDQMITALVSVARSGAGVPSGQSAAGHRRRAAPADGGHHVHRAPGRPHVVH